jgi:hypothetical protein
VYIQQYINKTRRTYITGLQYGLQYDTVYGTARAGLSKVPYTSPKFFGGRRDTIKNLKNTQQGKQIVPEFGTKTILVVPEFGTETCFSGIWHGNIIMIFRNLARK